MSVAVGVATTRPLRAADEPLVRAWFAETRDDLWLLPPDVRDAVLDMQWRARRAQWATDHPEARREAVVVDGRAVGYLIADERDDTMQIVDIAVARTERGHGIGSKVLRRLLAEADERGLPVELSVWTANDAARRLYERFGFIEQATVTGYHLMRRIPEGCCE